MANCYIFDIERFKNDIRTAPKKLRDIMMRYPPNRLYRLKKSNQLVTIDGYLKNGRIGVSLECVFNPGLLPDFNGYEIEIAPDALEECALPKGFKNPHGWNWVDPN